MAIPLDTLLDYESNIYEIISAVIKRAHQLTDIRVAYTPTTIEEQEGVLIKKDHDINQDEKAVSIAFREIFEESVVYKIHDE